MKLGDIIKLDIERKPLSDNVEPVRITGEFIVLGISLGLSHCFNDDLWSPGFNSFEYGERQKGRPDTVRLGSVYVPKPANLDQTVMKDLVCDNKKVSWEVVGNISEATSTRQLNDRP